MDLGRQRRLCLIKRHTSCLPQGQPRTVNKAPACGAECYHGKPNCGGEMLPSSFQCPRKATVLRRHDPGSHVRAATRQSTSAFDDVPCLGGKLKPTERRTLIRMSQNRPQKDTQAHHLDAFAPDGSYHRHPLLLYAHYQDQYHDRFPLHYSVRFTVRSAARQVWNVKRAVSSGEARMTMINRPRHLS